MIARWMATVKRTIILGLLLYTMFAQPGLPACWLMENPCAVHFHLPGMEEVPHSHIYLFDLVRASSGPALPSVDLVDVQLFALLGLIEVWKEFSQALVLNQSWDGLALYHPPKTGS